MFNGSVHASLLDEQHISLCRYRTCFTLCQKVSNLFIFLKLSEGRKTVCPVQWKAFFNASNHSILQESLPPHNLNTRLLLE